MSDTISPLPSILSSFPTDVTGDVTAFADKWGEAKLMFGNSMMDLRCLLTGYLREASGHACAGEVSVDGIGVCRNRDDILVLDVSQVIRHAGDVAAGEDWDATTRHTLRYRRCGVSAPRLA